MINLHLIVINKSLQLYTICLLLSFPIYWYCYLPSLRCDSPFFSVRPPKFFLLVSDIFLTPFLLKEPQYE